ncbi:MAG: hypothetical protein V1690_02920 [Candidatus Moraniibacteriota bacterium]
MEKDKAEKQKVTQEKQNKDKQTALSEMLPKIECSFSNDQEAYTKAMESSNINACDCVSEETSRGKCKEAILDLNLYNQAIEQYNPDICNEIKEISIKQACATVVESGVNNLKEKDLQFLANVYANAHNSSAIQAYEKLLEAEPNNLGNLLALTLAYAEAGLKEQEQGGNQTLYVEKALAIIEKAKNLDANNAEVYRVEGYVYEIKPDVFKALSLYDKAIELDPNNILAYTGRGHAGSMIGILKKALEDFKKAAELDIDKEHISIYANLCRLESSSEDMLEEAIKNCKIVAATAKNVNPVFKAEAYQILATIYMQAKNYLEAESYLLKAKSLSPNDPNLYVTLANLAVTQEKYDEAQVNAQKAMELSPTKASLYSAFSYSLYKQEKYAEAINAANKGLSLIDNDVSLLAPNKPALKKDLYYILANIYNRIDDKENEIKFKELGDAVFKS